MNTAQTNNWRELTRVQQVLIYTVCYLQQLKWIGFGEGGHLKPSPKAQEAFTQMKAEGFHPSREEIDAALDGISAHCTRAHAEAAARCFADDRIIDWTEVVAWQASREAQESFS